MADIGTIECKLENCLADFDGSLVVTLRAPCAEKNTVRKIYDAVRSCQETANKRLTAQFAWYKEKRSLNANAYFHVLASEIAKATQQSITEIKRQLVFDYGVQIGAISSELGNPPEKAGVEYAKELNDFISPKGKPCVQYMVYKRTRDLDTSEMARLIDGAVTEAQQLGIETKTPEELDRIKALWANKKE